MNFFKTFLACLLAIVVGGIFSTIFSIMLFFGIVGAISSLGADSIAPQVKANSILHLNFDKALSDSPANSLAGVFDFSTLSIKETLTTRAAVKAIESAASDPNIKGVFIDLPLTFSLSTDAIYQLREALDDFRESSGKFVVSYADYYSQGGYWLASGADVLYMNPYGALEWSGLSSQVMFYKNTFEKFGVKPEIFRYGKYKSAIEPYMLDAMSPENRHQTQELLGSIWGSISADVAKEAGVEPSALQQMANTLELAEPRIAMEKGFIDTLAYRDTAVGYLAALTGEKEGKANLVKLSDYVRGGNYEPMGAPKIALYYADGAIMDISTGADREIIGNKMARDLEKLRRDSTIKAVVVRVNSPGGSVLASDIIYDQMVKLRGEKPVVVSMGSYAASGGYYIACPADEIIAAPTTLTGSIGVFGMMFNVEKGAKDFFGLDVDVVNTNTMSDLGNMFREMTPAERHFMQRGVDSTYVRFVSLVAKEREMSFEKANSLAQGRVWSGVEALSNGLVDELGTLEDALVSGASRANIAENYRVAVYPQMDDEGFGALLNAFSSKAVKWIMGEPSIEDLAKDNIEKLKHQQGLRAIMPYTLEVAL